MRSRLFHIVSCLLLAASTTSAVQAADLAQQRQFYDEAKRALAKGDKEADDKDAFHDYPPC